MENLIVIYDKEIKDKGRDSYIKAIKRQIPEVIVADVSKDGIIRDPYKVLFLKPLDELSLIHISEPTRQCCTSRMPSSA